MALIKYLTSISVHMISNSNKILPVRCKPLICKSAIRNFAVKQQKNTDFDENEPLQYSQSKAARWKARHSRSGGVTESDLPWYQPYVISTSLAVFLIYFCVLREENDIDIKLGSSLYQHIEGLEEKQIELRIAYNQDNNLDTKILEDRLVELQNKPK